MTLFFAVSFRISYSGIDAPFPSFNCTNSSNLLTIRLLYSLVSPQSFDFFSLSTSVGGGVKRNGKEKEKNKENKVMKQSAPQNQRHSTKKDK